MFYVKDLGCLILGEVRPLSFSRKLQGICCNLLKIKSPQVSKTIITAMSKENKENPQSSCCLSQQYTSCSSNNGKVKIVYMIIC